MTEKESNKLVIISSPFTIKSGEVTYESTVLVSKDQCEETAKELQKIIDKDKYVKFTELADNTTRKIVNKSGIGCPYDKKGRHTYIDNRCACGKTI